MSSELALLIVAEIELAVLTHDVLEEVVAEVVLGHDSADASSGTSLEQLWIPLPGIGYKMRIRSRKIVVWSGSTLYRSVAMAKGTFASRALPFMALMGLGSWGLSQFLRLPTQLKDENKRRKKQGREKFNLEQEHEVSFIEQALSSLLVCTLDALCVCSQRMLTMLADEAKEYEYKRVPGPRPKGRQPAP